ncbi:MAG: chromosome segregation protein SMC [Gammaproteobacteria bacterium]|nr:MAG: chromosome segregation protein SMC [Gammaproteobacteria bacterium]
MRLRNIKLAGFKSFVDPTTLHIPGNLVGVVGPNGCGKSNIIDAVMWVMGESSAKHLRGDSLTDVIFNGSSARNPVGQATVELLFDNSEGRAGGQYASYSEISIKRQINRDAISTYYLNGTRCRRRDIQEIFLGTGLGPRSYAIIEQGTISRLIEAKPEELRTFIEEAAGVSKYRERRRETENRIKHTKENISRLTDIRDELEKQLNHLQRQAKAAERYQGLKKEERQLQAELLALNWKHLKAHMKDEEELVVTQENLVEAGLAGLRQVESDIEKYRDELVTANEGFNTTQSNLYGVGGEISRLEQKIQHTKERISSIEEDIKQAQREEADANQHIQQDKNKLQALVATAGTLEPKLQGSRNESNKAYEFLNDAEQAMQGWQAEWDTFNEASADYSRQEQVGETRLEHLQQDIGESLQGRKALEQELEAIDEDAICKATDEHTASVKTAEEKQAESTRQLEAKRETLLSLRNEAQALNEKANEHRRAQQKLEGRLSSLEALQQSSFGKDQEKVSSWLESTGLTDKPRLAQQLEVETDWVRAVEVVLQDDLQDIIVDDHDQYTTELAALSEGNLGIISAAGEQTSAAQTEFVRLADKIKASFSLAGLLDGIYVAESLEAAQEIRKQLKVNESVITADGIWLGRGWSRVCRGMDEQNRTLTREQEIQELKARHTRAELQLEELEATIESSRDSHDQVEQALNDLQSSLRQNQEELSGFRASLAASRVQQEQVEARKTKINEELVALDEQTKDDEFEIETINNNLQSVSGNRKGMEDQREALINLKEQHRSSLESARQRWQSTHEESHGIALQLESISSQRASIEQGMKRNQMQLEHTQKRCEDLRHSLNEHEKPVQGYQDELELKLKDKVSAEKLLADARTLVQTIETNLRESEESRSVRDQKQQELRELLEKARLATQESHIRLQTVEEQLESNGHEVTSILEQLAEDASVDVWKERLEGLARKIQRLGPINLAAIDEYSQLSERKTYLDSQDEDLTKALNTLDNAIHKIDKETRTRFKETFDKLNTNLKERFPQLFGGGHAYLELIGEDLLQTGVTIMARPPGKRNSTIHLLSGGEKALTAVALVFSIFELNPAPFCILDEVDAPLDDANVGRYSEMVAKMSSDVQFIFITHNKITMEIANQLLGVTMHEPGVSRLVSVDVDEAVEIAAIA